MGKKKRETEPQTGNQQQASLALFAFVFIAVVAIGGFGWKLLRRTDPFTERASTSQSTKAELSDRTATPPDDGETTDRTDETTSQQRPALVVDKERYYFGQVRVHDRRETQFTLTNRGDRPIKIGKLNISCKCILATVGRTELGPGEETKLDVTLIAKKRGTWTYIVKIPSNDPERKAIKMTFPVTIRDTLDVNPTKIVFGLVEPETPVTRSVVVDHLDKKPFAITSADVSRKDFVISDCQADTTGSSYTIRLTAKPSIETARGEKWIMATLTINTDLDEAEPLRVNLTMRPK